MSKQDEHSALLVNSHEDTEHTEHHVEKKTKFGLKDMPRPVFFIIIMELCERFSYYGLRSILTKYLRYGLNFEENQAKAIYSYFTGFAYFMPIFGGFIADAVLGKFWTIFTFTLFYITGFITMAVTAIDHLRWGCFLALGLIAVGTGGIKPCVGAFGGEQLGSDNPALVSTYFHIFYFTINLGSVCSTLLTPIIRKQFSFALAFAIPAGLLAIAILAFNLGRPWYNRTPPKGSVLAKMLSVICTARREKKRLDTTGEIINPQEIINQRRKRVHIVNGVESPPMPDTEPHWLDYAKLSKPAEDVDDTKKVWNLLPIFCALPIFWALFDQQGSSWVLQADKMNRVVFDIEILSEQVQALNAGFILMCVPIFDGIIYPFFRNRGFKVTHLSRMIVGMFFAGSAYLFAAWNDWAIAENGVGVVPIYKQLPQYLIMTVAEVLISVTGLDFAYTQAPKSAKATVSSLYLLTTATGDTLAGIAFSSLKIKPMYFSLMCSGLMGLNIIMFFFIARWYDNNVACYTEDEVEQIEGTGEKATDSLLVTQRNSDE